jgi:RHS repeat-associated protein
MKFVPLFIGLGWLTAGTETVRNCSQIDITHALSYNYDLLGRLDDTTISNINASTWTGDYNYRKDGNLDDRTINSAPVENFAYTGDLLTDVDGTAVNWDNNGNMVAGLTSNIEWNLDKRLRHTDVGDDFIDCRYAPDGEMIYKRVYQDGIASESKFIVDTVGRFPVILLEINSANSQIVKTYFNAQGQTLMQRDGSQAAEDDRYFYIHDRLGSVRQLVNTAGQVVNCYVYDPFGNALDTSGETQETIENRFRFAGYKWDPITSMYNCNARWYDPVLARFTGRDPVLGKFAEPLTLHAYLYCLNDPINHIDPTGNTLGGLLTGAIHLAGRTAHAAGSYIAKNMMEESIIGLASMVNGVTQGTMNCLFGPKDMSDTAKFMIGFVAGFGEMQIGLRTNAKLGTTFSSTFNTTANSLASESQDLFTIRNAIGIGISIGVGALGDYAADSLDPFTLFVIGLDAAFATGLVEMGQDNTK